MKPFRLNSKDYVSVSRHSVQQLQTKSQRFSNLSGMQARDLIAAAVGYAAEFGVQRGNKAWLLQPLDKGFAGLVLAVIDTDKRSHAGGRLLCVKTVLTHEQAVANVQSFSAKNVKVI